MTSSDAEDESADVVRKRKRERKRERWRWDKFSLTKYTLYNKDYCNEYSFTMTSSFHSLEEHIYPYLRSLEGATC